MNITPKYRKYVVAFNDFNYIKSRTGIARTMTAHQKMFAEKDISYIGIFHIRRAYWNEQIVAFCEYGLLIDGVYYGVFQLNQVIELFDKWNHCGIKMISIHIHHLIHEPVRRINRLINAYNTVPVKCYIHDYYLCCRNYNLMKNGEKYCGGYGMGSEACKDCSSYSKARKRYEEIYRFISSNNIEFIAPSDIAKEVFCRYYPRYQDKVSVIPHQISVGEFIGNQDTDLSGRILKIAFLGYENPNKGWYEWKRVVDTYRDKYRFYIFNSMDKEYEKETHVKVEFNYQNLFEMTNQLRKEEIDAVFLWSRGPETYSYTYFESYAADAFVITCSESGNIAASVRNKKNGIVLENENELNELMADEVRLKDLIKEYKNLVTVVPETYVENNRICEMTMEEYAEKNVEQNLRIRRAFFVNYPLMKVLNRHYKKRFI